MTLAPHYGGTHAKVDSRAKDSALRDKSWISARVLRLHTPSMRPCTRLKNPDLLKKLRLRLVFSSQILESTFYISGVFAVIASKRGSGCVAKQGAASLVKS